MKALQSRKRIQVNTYPHGPNCRCFSGCFFDYEYQWGEWYTIEYNPTPESIAGMKEINDDAVKCRGESARRQFRVIDVCDEN